MIVARAIMESRRLRLLAAGWLLLGLAACGGPAPVHEIKPFGDEGPPPMVRQPGSEVAPIQPPGMPGPAGESGGDGRGFTPEEEIVFTDPDDPEASLPQLSGILNAPSIRRGPWERSFTTAKRLAVREGKPILMWFTDSARSPRCEALKQELFTQPEFQEWATRHLIRLRIDRSEPLGDDLSLGQQETLRVDLKNYVKRLKRQYHVLGTPSLVLLSPSGKVVGRYRGYEKGDAEFTWGQLKQAVAVAERSYKEWREELEGKGYRTWTDRRGREVFAKLTRYHDGKLTLVEPDGTRATADEAEFSLDDRRWIAEQKRLRSRR